MVLSNQVIASGKGPITLYQISVLSAGEDPGEGRSGGGGGGELQPPLLEVENAGNAV